MYKILDTYRNSVENFCLLANLFNFLTKSERKILSMLYQMELKRQRGEYKAVFPSIKTIASVTKTSESTVHRFISKIKKDDFLSDLLEIEERYINGKDSSHSFKMSEDLFFFLSYLKIEGALFSWAKHKKRVMNNVHKSNDLIVKRIEQRYEQLVKQNETLGHRGNDTLLDIFIKYFRIFKSTLPTEASQQSESAHFSRQMRDLEYILLKANMSKRQIDFIKHRFSLQVIFKAVKNVISSICYMRIKKLDSFFFNRLFDAEKYLAA